MQKYTNEAELLIDNMLKHFDVSTYSDLAQKISTTQASISSWKMRNSINAIKKKCRELGIYDEIFGDLNSNINNKSQHIGSITNSNVANNLQNQHNTTGGQNHTDTDEATFSLYKEAYKKAKENERIKEFRIYLMSF